MNTTFKILWFEDEITWFNMEKLHVEDILRSHYLTSSITRKDGDDFEIDDLTGNDYDLILIDFKLANGVTGDTIISALRDHSILTDTLFYSSEEETMLNAIRAKMPSVDGIYLAKREYTTFSEKLKGIINKIVRRSEDVVNLRGFVLDQCSDFELRIKEILNICWQKFDDQQRELLVNSLFKLLDNKKSRIENQINYTHTQDVPFTCANNDDYILTIANRLDIFKTALSVLSAEYNLSSTVYSSDFKQLYTDKISIYRNKLGHVKLGESIIQINGKDVEIDQNLHRLLRKNIAEVDSIICRIENHITKQM